MVFLLSHGRVCNLGEEVGRDPVILQIPCYLGMTKGWARYPCFNFIKLISIEQPRAWEIFTGAWGNYYQHSANQISWLMNN